MVAIICGRTQRSVSFSPRVPRGNNIRKEKRWGRPPDRRHDGDQKNTNTLPRWLSMFVVNTLLLLAAPNNESSCLCQAFSPLGLFQRISPRNRSGAQFRGESVPITWRHEASTSPSLDATEEVSSSPFSKPETLLRQSIQLTLSEIEQFAKLNGISLINSHEDCILKDIHRQQQIDAQAMAPALPPEEEEDAGTIRKNNVPYQWLYTERTKKPLAIQTNGPILKDSTISWIREQANSIWNDSSSSTKNSLESRFTYQRKGNYEVHLADLVTMPELSDKDGIANIEIYEALQERIYPLAREAFGTLLGEEDPSSLQFCVYDAIVIRYNATEADLLVQQEHGNDENGSSSIPTADYSATTTTTRMGAGQPLHRDLGLVSVNVMLNSPDEFEGGGTFMEHQLQDLLWEIDNNAHQTEHPQQQECQLPFPLKPTGGPGHALLHLSSDRHAGASTRRGVRDILVFFLTAASKTTTSCGNDNGGHYSFSSSSSSIPILEQAARLKSKARSQCEECLPVVVQQECKEEEETEGNPSITLWQPLTSAYCRAKYQHLAVQSVPTDGEAWQYLAMALWDIHQALCRIQESQQSQIMDATFRYQQSLIKQSVSALEMAKEFTPCDARVYHNLAWILDQQQQQQDLYHDKQIQSHYSRAMELHQAFQKVGCDVGIDYDSTILNYGLYLANQDLFEEALSVLEWIEPSAMQVVMQQQRMQEQISGGAQVVRVVIPQEQKLQQRLGLIQDAQRLRSFCQRKVILS